MRKGSLILLVFALLLTVGCANIAASEPEKTVAPTTSLDNKLVGVNDEFFIFEKDGEKVFVSNGLPRLAKVNGKVTFLIKTIENDNAVILFSASQSN